MTRSTPWGSRDTTPRTARRTSQVTAAELAAAGDSKVVSTSAQQVLDEWLRGHQNVGRTVEGRLV